MSLLLSLWQAAAAWIAKPALAAAPGPDEARRRALRAVTLEQLRDSEWPCHPHF